MPSLISQQYSGADSSKPTETIQATMTAKIGDSALGLIPPTLGDVPCGPEVGSGWKADMAPWYDDDGTEEQPPRRQQDTSHLVSSNAVVPEDDGTRHMLNTWIAQKYPAGYKCSNVYVRPWRSVRGATSAYTTTTRASGSRHSRAADPATHCASSHVL